jgi:hypothetical protein
VQAAGPTDRGSGPPGSRVACRRPSVGFGRQQMLDAGLIQHSDNPFSSPALLVNKEDKFYRFCVDYKHLNAITMKGQYHVPIIDEFLDELKGASWFSSMDFCSGFHQILMNNEDSFKTAF